MYAPKRCERVREDLPAYAAGWLDAGRASEVASHLESCPDCAAYQRGDSALLAVIEAIEPAAPRDANWADVLAMRGRPAQPTRHAWRPRAALAAAAAMVIVGGLWLSSPPSGPPPGPNTGMTVERPVAGDTAAYVVVHNMVSVSGLAGDPNRAVMIATADGEAHR